MHFEMQFPPSEIDSLVQAYRADQKQMAREEKAFAAGKALRARRARLDDLVTIANWKSWRRLDRLRKNDEEDIAEACAFAARTTSDRCAMAVLCGLRGIKVPMASAILTVMFPDHHTVIDVNALYALGCTKKPDSVDRYLAYLAACRGLARMHGVSLRALDQALWKWGAEHQPRS